MGIIEKIKEIEVEMAQTQKNKAGMGKGMPKADKKWYAAPIDSSNYRSAKVPLETFVRIPSTCFDLASEIFIYFLELSVLTLAICYNLRGNDPFQVGKLCQKLIELNLYKFAASQVGLNGYIQLKFMKGFSADAKMMYEEASQVANDAVGSIRTIASFRAEEKVTQLYKQKCEGPMKTNIRQGSISGIGFGFSFFIYSLCEGLVRTRISSTVKAIVDERIGNGEVSNM
ncbi:hypothetical protein Syun_009429 [Stephania yunnanensis]|uniref:ABC transmembrane type-1 domain-containing protein n=1 Tax=Stephania yunnanensis TaxID=152371 RepID=A0AAP0PQV4_9MAGN